MFSSDSLLIRLSVCQWSLSPLDYFSLKTFWATQFKQKSVDKHTNGYMDGQTLPNTLLVFSHYMVNPNHVDENMSLWIGLSLRLILIVLSILFQVNSPLVNWTDHRTGPLIHTCSGLQQQSSSTQSITSTWLGIFFFSSDIITKKTGHVFHYIIL